MKDYLKYVKKALAGGLIAAAAAVTASADGGLTKEELTLAVGAFVAGAVAVFVPKNGPKPEKVTDEEIAELLGE